jgi:hypothetical protein
MKWTSPPLYMIDTIYSACEHKKRHNKAPKNPPIPKSSQKPLTKILSQSFTGLEIPLSGLHIQTNGATFQNLN